MSKFVTRAPVKNIRLGTLQHCNAGTEQRVDPFAKYNLAGESRCFLHRSRCYKQNKTDESTVYYFKILKQLCFIVLILYVI